MVGHDIVGISCAVEFSNVSRDITSRLKRFTDRDGFCFNTGSVGRTNQQSRIATIIQLTDGMKTIAWCILPGESNAARVGAQDG